MKIVIRAGGSGTRLWPLSRKKMPKQFQAINSNQSMIKDTYDRISSILESPDDLLTSVSYDHKGLVKKYIPVNKKNTIVEPSMKNTGPALCLEAMFIKDLYGDIVIATLPSDDYVNSSKAFCEMLLKAEKFIEEHPDYIVSPGTIPDVVDTGYSYIKTGRKIKEFGDYIFTYEIEDWIEKPGYEECQSLIDSGEYFYHTGMYIWKASTILELFKKMQPEIYKNCEQFVKLKNSNWEEASKFYDKCEKMSIESAVVHSAEKKAMIVSNKLKWSDVGKWYIFSKLMKTDKNRNVLKGQVVTKDTFDSVIISNSKRVVATLSVNDLVVVDTPDALFISDLSKSGEVKELLEDLGKDYPELL